MKPVNFEGVNAVYRAPGCDDLPAHRDDVPSITSHWQLSDEERDAIAKGGVFALRIIGTQQPPVALGVVLDGKAVE